MSHGAGLLEMELEVGQFVRPYSVHVWVGGAGGLSRWP